MKIGVIVESFREELDSALRSAADMGIEGVQIYARDPSHADLIDMSTADRKILLKNIRDLGLEVSAICGELGGHGFQDKAGNTERIDLSKKINLAPDNFYFLMLSLIFVGFDNHCHCA